MTQEEIKKFIAEKVDEDLSLSQIQDLLTEKGVKMTFMDLRLIASEIESGVWTRHEADSAPTSGSSGPLSEEEEDVPEGDDFPGEEEEDFPEDKAAAANTASAAGMQADSAKSSPALRGKTTVELSPLVRPGAIASGSVKFGSGASAEWFLDQQGRLGLEKAKGQPDRQDIQEFQIELQKALGV